MAQLGVVHFGNEVPFGSRQRRTSVGQRHLVDGVVTIRSFHEVELDSHLAGGVVKAEGGNTAQLGAGLNVRPRLLRQPLFDQIDLAGRQFDVVEESP